MAKTIKITIDTGALELGPVPAGTRVTLEFGYLHSKEARVPLGEAFAIEDANTRNRGVLERVAHHLVKSWSVSPDLDRAAVSAFLLALYDEEPVAASQIIERLGDRSRFGRPALVDADDLGKE